MTRYITLACVRWMICVGFSTIGLTSNLDNVFANETELAVLDRENFSQWAPAGKEVDAIDGDFVLRNQHIIAVIARPGLRRHANMTVGFVGGCIIDCTLRHDPNDQLSAYYPLAGQFRFLHPSSARVFVDDRPVALNSLETVSGSKIRLTFTGSHVNGNAEATITYELTNNDTGITIESTVTSNRAKEVAARDMIRADRTFRFGNLGNQLGWAYDDWFRQAYGIASDSEIRYNRDRREFFEFVADDKRLDIETGQTRTFTRQLIPAHDLIELLGIVNHEDDSYGRIDLQVVDANGPVEDAKITLENSDMKIAVRTDETGRIVGALPRGSLQMSIDAPARPPVSRELKVAEEFAAITETLETCGYLTVQVAESQNRAIPFKMSIFGIEGTKDPFFGPDSRAQFVMNAAYSANGKIDRLGLAPGKYQCLISRGPEYDADLQEIEVKQNEVTSVSSILKRSVDTSGWISAEYHSHSSPSGDNTSDQRGRVLNLLAEHIEFAPCTEHNRVDSYVPHLEALGVVGRMATCSGMELTGSLSHVNHQNAFPLERHLGEQDGGAPVTDGNPVAQIRRLAMWDDASEKLVQMNHPNLMQVLGDRDADGKADQGFTEMFDYTDVIEIHPLQSVFRTETSLPEPGSRGNTIFQWMQLLNHGYRIPGVVNTDAHYNFHGSGWLRNYIRCSTDDPSEIETQEMVRNSTAGKLLMTNGPFMEVSVFGKNSNEQPVVGEIGEEIEIAESKIVVRIKVQCANWLDVNRVQILINGRADPKLNFTRRTHPAMFASGVVKFENQVEVTISEDSHLMVVAAGEGLKLGRVVGPNLADRMPVALSNPIFIDVDGNGFKPNRDDLGAPMTLPTNR